MVCTVGCVCSFRRSQIFMDFASFLSMMIYEVLDRLLWFLDTELLKCNFTHSNAKLTS